MAGSHPNPRSNHGFIPWLVLALLLGTQLGIVAHSHEHRAEDCQETCAVCSQLDRDDAPVLCLLPEAPDLSGFLPAPAEFPSIEAGPGFSIYSARASP